MILLITDFISILFLTRVLLKIEPFLKISKLTVVPFLPRINLTAPSMSKLFVGMLFMEIILSFAWIPDLEAGEPGIGETITRNPDSESFEI